MASRRSCGPTRIIIHNVPRFRIAIYLTCDYNVGSSISGDVTPVSVASELDFNSNEATAGSITDHDLLVCIVFLSKNFGFPVERFIVWFKLQRLVFVLLEVGQYNEKCLPHLSD